MTESSKEIHLDVELFMKRTQALYKKWERGDLFKGTDSLVIVVGKLDEDMVYSKSTAFHIYFFAYEFPDTIIVYTEKTVYFLASAKKLAIFKQLESDEAKAGFRTEFIERTKTNGQQCFDTLWAAMQASKEGKTMGVVQKDLPNFTNSAIKQWIRFVEDKGPAIEQVDIGPAIGQMLAVKDNDEKTILGRAGALSGAAMMYVQQDMLEVIVSEVNPVYSVHGVVSSGLCVDYR
eukprot:Ihof_evm2s583 gene=Ihof_evmTU2s583